MRQSPVTTIRPDPHGSLHRAAPGRVARLAMAGHRPPRRRALRAKAVDADGRIRADQDSRWSETPSALGRHGQVPYSPQVAGTTLEGRRPGVCLTDRDTARPSQRHGAWVRARRDAGRNQGHHLPRHARCVCEPNDRAGHPTRTALASMGHEDARITLSRYAHLYDRERTDKAVRQAMAAAR